MLQDNLVYQSTQDVFLPQGRDDILTQAIRRPEHLGCVRGTGGFWGLRDYFGASETTLVHDPGGPVLQTLAVMRYCRGWRGSLRRSSTP